MRLWSLHPGTLDRIGLIALWRETLLAWIHNSDPIGYLLFTVWGVGLYTYSYLID